MDTQLTQETEAEGGVIWHELLPPSDWSQMSEDERCAFHDMDEALHACIKAHAEKYQQHYPHLGLEWTFQIEAYVPKNENEELPDA